MGFSLHVEAPTGACLDRCFGNLTRVWNPGWSTRMPSGGGGLAVCVSFSPGVCVCPRRRDGGTTRPWASAVAPVLRGGRPNNTMSASHSSNQGGPGGRGSYNKGNSFTPRCCFAFYYILRIRASLRASSFQEVSKLFSFYCLPSFLFI